jgi:hypothetical protein
VLERMQGMLIAAKPADPEVEEELRRLQCTREERVRRFRREGVFPVDEWLAEGPPPTPEELQEMEELLRMREEEREASLAREAGVSP